MKYAKFEKLDLILKQQNSSINEFAKSITGKSLPINEATKNPPKIQTKKPEEISIDSLKIEPISFKGEGMEQFKKLLTSPRTALNMRKIIKAAKRLEVNIQTKLVDEYYPKIMEGQKNVLMQILQLEQQGQKAEEIVKQLQEPLKTAKEASAKMLKHLTTSVEKIIESSSKRINKHIESLAIKDINKERLENLWLVATTGIMENFLGAIINNQAEFINKNAQDPKIKKILAVVSNVRAIKKQQADEEAKKAEKKAAKDRNKNP